MTGNDEIGGTIETWQIRKPAVESPYGMVASQHFEASQAGARVLAEGGNAVDAAVAAGVAIGTVEPWMSGLGGGGHMLVYLAAEDRAFDVDFAMRAPRALNPDDYPLVSGTDSDLFGWPAVVDNRNVVGPCSFAVPGFVAGMAAGFPAAPAALSPRLPLSLTVHTDRYDDSFLEATVDAYDQRRSAVQPTPKNAQRDTQRFGVQDNYGWSEDKARQVSRPQRADFGQYLRAQGFRLD